MGNKNQQIKLALNVEVKPSIVFDAFSNATALTEWLCAIAQADAHPGGRLYLWWESGYYVSGEYIELLSDSKIVFSWHGRAEPGITRVKVSFMPSKNGTRIILVHSGFDSSKAWSTAKREIKRTWSNTLENLKSILETGIDLRISRRPMLGVYDMQEVTPELALKLNLPGKYGMILGNIVDGMGAAAAGLQKDDILVKFAGEKFTGLNAWNQVIQNFSAGDQVKVIYYRQGKKVKGHVVLSPRPLPDIPSDAEALAALALKINHDIQQQMILLLANTSEAAASVKVDPQEWNLKEVLAHLIAVERDVHTWFSGIIEGQEGDANFHSNLAPRLNAIIASYPAVLSLQEEYFCNMNETAALLANLPEEFVARKRSYWRLGYNLMQLTTIHTADHLQQIKKIIDSPQPPTALEVDQWLPEPGLAGTEAEPPVSQETS